MSEISEQVLDRYKKNPTERSFIHSVGFLFLWIICLYSCKLLFIEWTGRL